MKKCFFPTIPVLALFAVLLTSALRGDESRVGYETYTSADGAGYAAVGLRGAVAPSTSDLDVAFLIDTSASQTGQTRRDTLGTLRAAIKALPKNAKVQVLAMDVDTESLTNQQFFPKNSPDLEAALLTLERRVPLGATDMAKGLEMTKTVFANSDPGARHAVIYLGDGRSLAKTVDPATFETVVGDFAKQRIPFTACAVGIQSNLGLIGALANRTGGNLVDMNTTVQAGMKKALEEAEERGEKEVVTPDFGLSVGQRLAQAADATVIWPNQQSVSFPQGWDVYPKQLQPIRSDRETVVVAKTAPDNLVPFDLNLKGKAGDSDIEIGWKLEPAKDQGSNSMNSYLAAVVDTAAKDQGKTMPIVGWNTLEMLQDAFNANIEDILNKAEVSIKTDNTEQAKVFVDNALKLDPTNGTARRLHDVLQGKASPTSLQDSAENQAVTPKPSMVDAAVMQQSALNQKVQNEVNQAIVDAGKRAAHDPEGAIQNLKLTLASLRDNTSLDPDQRNVMLDRVGNILRQTEEKKRIDDIRRQEQAEAEASRTGRMEALDKLESNKKQAVQIMKRFDALMDAKEYEVATSVANVAMELIPDSTAPFVAQRTSELINYVSEYAMLRYKRHTGFIGAFMSAERSAIPISDEPPLLYPDPETWRLLSERRKERYSPVDLSQSGPAEKKINKALDRNIDLELDENTTFEDLFRIIKDKNPGFNIIIDSKGAGALGITSGSPVVKEPFTVHGIKLRSALHRILSEQDLTYCIRDEMLQITSVDEAKQNLSIKVYPVADLVVDPTPISGGMGGMMGGMGSSMNGGGMSGMGGGGMGGMGGGMGGMGGGGMGGGMFNVPSAIQSMGGKPANGFSGNGLFSVPDSVTKDVPAQAKSLAKGAMSSADAKAFWNDYFTKNAGNVNKELVHETVKQLKAAMKDGETTAEKNVVALVETAILNDEVQGWMYEALALSLVRMNAPKKEIERAVLSAADFCENPQDMMKLGQFMRGLGLQKRAFDMYQQSLELLIPQSELYAATFRLANDLDDEESLRWISLKTLEQEWSDAVGLKLSQQALDYLSMLEAKMKKAGKTEQAEKLGKEIENAMIRDCVVTIEWTGSAGVDISIKEPTDSYCWFNNPRTQAGGLIKEPVVQAIGDSTVNKISYVCAKAFNGQYALVIQKNWGQLTNNTVKVTVETGVVPGSEPKDGTATVLDPEGNAIFFTLESGRRQEPLNEAQLHVANVRQNAAQKQLNRNALLQRLSDAGVLAQVFNDGGSGQYVVPTGGNGSGSRSAYPYPFIAPSVVGYRPVITVLPDGSSLYSNAVVSADRRYVRISPSPMFSTIKKVQSFNIQSGNMEDIEDNTGGGSGGGGFSGGGSGGGSF